MIPTPIEKPDLEPNEKTLGLQRSVQMLVGEWKGQLRAFAGGRHGEPRAEATVHEDQPESLRSTISASEHAPGVIYLMSSECVLYD